MGINYRFAVCTKDGILINQHFGHAEFFHIYDYAQGKAKLLETRQTKKYCSGEEDDDKILNVVNILQDCDCIICMRIGDYPQKVLKEHHINVHTTYNRIAEGIKEAVSFIEKG